ncbi:MAG: hypothetical protein M3082_11625 [Candidatus Dormibacteraeota bacterium]|nr:hypothetical protein [Candidatus Dormibacteraeota bacterium]
MQKLAETQDTPWSATIPVRDAGVGVGTTVQAAPFQASTRVPLSYDPAAVHELAETQDTPWRRLYMPGSALETINQLEPFQASTRVAVAGFRTLLMKSHPTAVQELAETQETP